MKKKPNIILFITHDQGTHIRCYNTPQNPNSLHTPNLDKLAGEGVKFTNYFCSSPGCSPSRGSIQTSLFPHQNGLMGLVNRGWNLPETNKTLPMYLKENGYTTHLFGFQHEARDVSTLGYDTVTKKLIPSCALMEQDYTKFFKKHKKDEKPFYLNIGTTEVHRPFILYGKPTDPRTVKVPPYLPDHKKVRIDLAEFYGAIHSVDSVIGNILKCLEETGLKEDTIFIFTTDHGIAFPRAKCSLYDPGIKTALLMNWPKSDLINSGKVFSSILSNVDLLPTILELIGADIPEGIEGKSFIPLLKGDQESIHEEIFAEKSFHEVYDPIRCVRTQNYKFIRNFYQTNDTYQLTEDIPFWKLLRKENGQPRPEEELYDLSSDSHEMNNLINDDKYKSIAKDLRHKLQTWLERTNDPVLKGVIRPQSRWLDNWTTSTIFHKVFYFFLLNNLLPRLMRYKGIHKKVMKLMRRIS